MKAPLEYCIEPMECCLRILIVLVKKRDSIVCVRFLTISEITKVFGSIFYLAALSLDSDLGFYLVDSFLYLSKKS